MTEVRKRPTLEELTQSVNDYIADFKKLDKEEAKTIATQALIETGVLDDDGNPKETIVTGCFFGI